MWSRREGEGGQKLSSIALAAMHMQVQKKKVWEEVQPELKTDVTGVAVYRGVPMLTSAGPVRAASLTGGNVS